jgi:hypothetical protein
VDIARPGVDDLIDGVMGKSQEVGQRTARKSRARRPASGVRQCPDVPLIRDIPRDLLGPIRGLTSPARLKSRPMERWFDDSTQLLRILTNSATQMLFIFLSRIFLSAGLFA